MEGKSRFAVRGLRSSLADVEYARREDGSIWFKFAVKANPFERSSALSLSFNTLAGGKRNKMDVMAELEVKKGARADFLLKAETMPPWLSADCNDTPVIDEADTLAINEADLAEYATDGAPTNITLVKLAKRQ